MDQQEKLRSAIGQTTLQKMEGAIVAHEQQLFR
jgi:hypothetical protein